MTSTPPDGTTITYTSAGRARRMDEARRSLKAAMAAIRGMDKALRADWMDPRGGE